MERDWLYISEFATAYEVHPDTIRRYIEMGDLQTLPRATKHARVRIAKTEFDRLKGKSVEKMRGTERASESKLKTTATMEMGKVDPILLEAQKEHLGAIRWLIEVCKKVVYTVDIHHIDPSEWEPGYYIEPIYKVEENPLFSCLREHVPIETLWHDYQKWREKFFDYVDICYKIIHEIRRVESHFADGKDLGTLYIRQGLENLILDCIQFINPWIGMFGRPGQDWRDNIVCQPSKYEPREFSYRILGEAGKETLMADGYRVLVAKDAQAVIVPFQSFVDNFLSGEDVTKVRILYCELRDLETRIQRSLDEILIRQDYIKHNCRLCPRH